MQSLIKQGFRPLASDPIFAREILSFIDICNSTSIIETGTFKADTTRFFVNAFSPLPIFTCDVKIEYASDAMKIFEHMNSVHIAHANSPEFLRKNISLGLLGKNPFFFLDAHWYDYLPLLDELREILTLGKGTVCIHDFKVPNMAEFKFDTYNGMPLSVEMIRPILELTDVRYDIYFPCYPSPLLKLPEDVLVGRCYILLNQDQKVINIFDILSYAGQFVKYSYSNKDNFELSTNKPLKILNTIHSWKSSSPKIDLILAGPQESAFSWNQREGWANTLTERGFLNNTFWVWDEPNIINYLFASLRQSSADFVLILSGDHHQYHLHNTLDKQFFWKNLNIPSICHCAERILDSPFRDSEQKSKSAIEAFDAFLYIDELSATLFDQSEKPSLWIPQYVDEKVFLSKLPFQNRKNRIHFRGKWDDYGIHGVYYLRRKLIEKIKNYDIFDISEAYKPLLTVDQAAELKASFRFVLNAPANCPGYSSALYESMACGCSTFQYELHEKETLSLSLFKPGVHFLPYNPEKIDEFLSEADYAIKHWQDYQQIAKQGMEECLEKHTINKRTSEILNFLETNWPRLSKKSNYHGTQANVYFHDERVDRYNTVRFAVESIAGLLVTGQEEFLFNKVKNLPNDAIILEIGSYKGRSTVAMGYACKGTRRKIYSVDTWEGNETDFDERNFFEIWQNNVKRNGLSQYIFPLKGRSNEILSQWDNFANGVAIDFVFIDGSHQYLDVLKDFEMSYVLIKKGGRMAFHDVVDTWPGPQHVWHDIVKHILVNHEYSTTLACGQKMEAIF